MQVITISGFKGGTGKTTLAALIGVAAVQDGLRVAALDLDRNTRNLTNFLTLRRASGLASPDHVMLMDLDKPAKRKPVGRLDPLVNLARMDGYDLLIIDTSSGNQTDVYEAHLLADVILTPMNESPADVHGLFTPPKAQSAPQINYRDLIDTVRFDRMRARHAGATLACVPQSRFGVCRPASAGSFQTRSTTWPPKPASTASGSCATVSPTAPSRWKAEPCSTNQPMAISP